MITSSVQIDYGVKFGNPGGEIRAVLFNPLVDRLPAAERAALEIAIKSRASTFELFQAEVADEMTRLGISIKPADLEDLCFDVSYLTAMGVA